MDGGLKGGDFALDNTAAPKVNRIMSLFNREHKTAIVTGATAGIGYAVARGLAEAGANVAIWYNSNDATEKAAAIEKEFGVKCGCSPAKRTDIEAIDDLTDTLLM